MAAHSDGLTMWPTQLPRSIRQMPFIYNQFCVFSSIYFFFLHKNQENSHAMTSNGIYILFAHRCEHNSMLSWWHKAHSHGATPTSTHRKFSSIECRWNLKSKLKLIQYPFLVFKNCWNLSMQRTRFCNLNRQIKKRRNYIKINKIIFKNVHSDCN